MIKLGRIIHNYQQLRCAHGHKLVIQAVFYQKKPKETGEICFSISETDEDEDMEMLMIIMMMDGLFRNRWTLRMLLH